MHPDVRAYEHLHALSRNARILQGISSLLSWDQETYMPEQAVLSRSEQTKLIAGLSHKQLTGKPFSKALSKLIDIESGEIHSTNLSEAQKAALREWRREYLIDKAIPKKFVENFAKLTSQSVNVWRHAKQQNNFHAFAPFLDKIIVTVRKKAELIGFKQHPYDALLDLYEPGVTSTDLIALFKPLRNFLTDLLKKIHSKHGDDQFLHGEFLIDRQIAFCKKLLDTLKYDFARGRLDQSEHPFSSSSHPNDSRITSHFHKDNVLSGISAVLHEAGHAFYEMGLPAAEYGSPLCQARSLGVHESQSRWWETFIGQSKPFWTYFLPELKLFFPKLNEVSLNNFYSAINQVKPSLIRVEADEVTYCLHIILRFEIEHALIEGSLNVRQLPEVWNEKMQELLGIVPTTNSEGCLQDIHWAWGSVGYFPSYALGNLYAAHLFQGFAKQFPDWEKKVSEGEFAFIKDWLHQHIYQHGCRYSSKELLQMATGKPFSADAYMRYLSHKYQ